jgi:hypothetical protein
MDDVELDRPVATRLEVNEQEPPVRPEQVARVRLAMQELLRGVAVDDRPPQASQRLTEKFPVRVTELRGAVAAPDQRLSLLDSIREVRRRHVDLPHAGVQPLERVGVFGWSNLSRRHRFVMGPERDREAIACVNPRLDSGLESSDRTPRFGEPLSKLDFERCNLMAYIRDPGKDVTGQQAHSELVRGVQNDRVINAQTKR